MAFMDYLWIIRLAIEILKLLAGMSPEERTALHDLKMEIGDLTMA